MLDFVQQYNALNDRSPHLAVGNWQCENSDYSDQLSRSRNAYMCFNGDGIEDCYYTYDSRWNQDCADMSYSNKSEFCYECIDCDECYNCDFCQDCERCNDCQWCYDCFASRNCFGCIGLRHGEYQIFNERFSPADYARRLSEVRLWDAEKIRAEVMRLRAAHPHLAMRTRRSEEVFGDYIFDSKNIFYGFKIHDCEDCSYLYNCRGMKDCYDTGMAFESELAYEVIEANRNYHSNFLYWCANCRDCEYMMCCFDCEHCFGCINLKRGKYHILNEPHEKDAYFEKVAEIKRSLRASGRYMNFLPDIVAHS